MFRGFAYGLISSCSFGLIPYFTLPLMAAGMNSCTALAYRFIFSALILALVVIWRRDPLVIDLRDILRLGLLSFFYAGAAVTFFVAFRYLDSGVCATLQFTYPVYVVLYMICFIHEKARLSTFAAMAMSIGGVALISLHGGGHFSLWAVLLVLFSAMLNAAYVAGMQVVRLRVTSGLSITLWLMIFGAVYAVLYAMFEGAMCLPEENGQWIDLLLLAVVTGVVSNLTLVESVRRIGSTVASVLGALEPLTALCVGVVVFGEPLTWRGALGCALIIAAVLLIMAAPHLGRKKA